MKDELIERVARELCRANGHTALDTLVFCSVEGSPDYGSDVPCWALYKTEAIAAISAIRPGAELPCGIVMPMEAIKAARAVGEDWFYQPQFETQDEHDAKISALNAKGDMRQIYVNEGSWLMALLALHHLIKAAKSEKDAAP